MQHATGALWIIAVFTIALILFSSFTATIAASIIKPPKTGFISSFYAVSLTTLINVTIILFLAHINRLENVSAISWLVITTASAITCFSLFYRTDCFTALMLYAVCLTVLTIGYCIFHSFLEEARQHYIIPALNL